MEAFSALRRDIMKLAEQYPQFGGAAKSMMEAGIQGMKAVGQSQREGASGVKGG